MSFRFVCCMAALMVLLPLGAQAKPLVVSSLKPLTLIAREVAGTYADVDTLLPASASHHNYPLKVSDHDRLQKADVFLWVGPELESFLQKPLHNVAPMKIVTAYDLAGLSWPLKTVEAHDHHHARDPHLWLDPRNAIIVAKALGEKLAAVDAVNAAHYRANTQLFIAKTQRLDDSLMALLKPVKNVGFAVYHEGFAHFVGRYGLHQLDYVAFTPEQKPGAKHMHQLRSRLAASGKCLFLEPYNDMQALRDLARELNLRLGMLDALGTQGATSYGQLMEQMAGAFSACLANGRNQ